MKTSSLMIAILVSHILISFLHTRKVHRNFNTISHKDLLDMIHQSNFKLLKVEPKVIYIDDYFPFKYVNSFFQSIMDTFEVIDYETLKEVKSVLVCRDTHDEEHNLIPKVYFRNLEIIMRKLSEITNSSKDFKKYFSRTLSELESIAKALQRKCVGAAEFMNFINSKLRNADIFKNTNFTPKNEFTQLLNSDLKVLSSQAAYTLKLHNFEKSGTLIGHLLNYVNEKSIKK